MPRAASPQSIDSKIGRRIERSARGVVFTAANFASLGSRAAIDQALARLAAAGKIRRLSRGLYDKPRQDELLGKLWPTPKSVIRALQQQHSLRLQATGLYAANLLGLSEQVPAKIELLTDVGKSRSVRAGPMQIVLKATSPRNMATANSLTGLVIQALKSVGSDHITPERIAHLRATIPESERRKMLSKLALAPSWMRPFLREIAGGVSGASEKRRRKT